MSPSTDALYARPNICIYAMSVRNPSVARHLLQHDGAVAISDIALAELLFGVARSQRKAANREELSRFLAPMTVLPFDSEAALHFGEIKASLFRSGTVIGPMDMLIAAHARSLELTLVTNNRKEFDRVPGLVVENWL